MQDFAASHPDVTELVHLAELLSQYNEVGQFSRERLRYDDIRREHTLRGVVRHMLASQANYAGESERVRLQKWAQSVLPTDFASVGVKGFGLAGFQYMRMLFGSQTTKPDVHIINFVSRILGRTVNAITALRLLEKAAERVNLPLREVDGAIWAAGALK